MSHEDIWTRLPDLLEDRDQPELLGHVAACYDCQRQLFLLGRVDRILRDAGRVQRKERRHGRRRRWLRFPAGLAAAVAVALVLIVIILPHSRALHHFTLRTAAGRPIGHAILARADAQNQSLTFVARGIPTRRGGDIYILWGGSDGRPDAPVGRFMIDASGACRTRFNLPSGRWARFWVTPPGHPQTVVATT